MIRITLNETTWTLVGTGAAEFLVQNTSGNGVTVAYGAAPPSDAVLTGFWLKPNWTMSNLGTDDLYARGTGTVDVHPDP